jgi:hypothetical protein
MVRSRGDGKHVREPGLARRESRVPERFARETTLFTDAEAPVVADSGRPTVADLVLAVVAMAVGLALATRFKTAHWIPGERPFVYAFSGIAIGLLVFHPIALIRRRARMKRCAHLGLGEICGLVASLSWSIAYTNIYIIFVVVIMQFLLICIVPMLMIINVCVPSKRRAMAWTDWTGYLASVLGSCWGLFVVGEELGRL